MSVLDALPATTHAILVKGFWFRTRVLSLEDASEHGVAMAAALASLPADDLKASKKPKDRDGLYDGMSPARIQKSREFLKRVCCAAVDGICAATDVPDGEEPSGGQWENMRFVERREQENRARGLAHVDTLDALAAGSAEVLAAFALSAATQAGREVRPLSSSGEDGEVNAA